ncbi:LysM peptidoglycan-binding domain-containing M23 family metallopeptidase [Streptomyces sp. NPDC007861]|uniref:M23 family metallopeptidase n=1 Tax=Streptomyces sp. NPDC007861 TaxID=3154893 RepID=UPI003405DBCA
MPAKGKHRRPRTSPFTRGFVAAGTGGAAIALPFIGAAGAHAAGKAAPAAAPEHIAAVSAVTAQKAAGVPHAVKAGKAAKTYTVVAGDHLSKIAAEQDITGGWQKLYADNRAAVGGNPSLIHPGLELAIGAKAKAAAPAPAKAEAPAEAAPKAAEKAAEKAAPQSEAPAKVRAEAPAKAESAAAPAEAPAAAQAATVPGSRLGYTAPVAAGVSTAYRTAGAMWSSGYHTGVDFAAATGTSIKSVGPGAVVSAGWAGAYGNQVVIRHEDGTYSQYAHLSSLSIGAGESVTGGQQIGLSGSTGNSSGPHLHFEIRTTPNYGSDIDPVAHLRSHGVTL